MLPHTATATSHFVLTFIALTATITHLSLGEFGRGISETMCLGVGVMMGAPPGGGNFDSSAWGYAAGRIVLKEAD
jgi:hypothetical protein